ncbi:hypothetical protein [Agathobaculum sp. Marseille-P7918]|uniref:hypothetical protein n=1 Tax=Agathobaculum sp. Marseille-P7918 TaxID=2479843 RepID=UPI003564A856
MYASEADVLNMALFGMIAKLNAIAISQMEILTQDHRIEALEAHSGELSPME